MGGSLGIIISNAPMSPLTLSLISYWIHSESVCWHPDAWVTVADSHCLLSVLLCCSVLFIRFESIKLDTCSLREFVLQVRGGWEHRMVQLWRKVPAWLLNKLELKWSYDTASNSGHKAAAWMWENSKFIMTTVSVFSTIAVPFYGLTHHVLVNKFRQSASIQFDAWRPNGRWHQGLGGRARVRTVYVLAYCLDSTIYPCKKCLLVLCITEFASGDASSRSSDVTSLWGDIKEPYDNKLTKIHQETSESSGWIWWWRGLWNSVIHAPLSWRISVWRAFYEDSWVFGMWRWIKPSYKESKSGNSLLYIKIQLNVSRMQGAFYSSFTNTHGSRLYEERHCLGNHTRMVSGFRTVTHFHHSECRLEREQ